MKLYADDMSARGVPRHQGENKLRDVADEFDEQGHSFAYNGDLLYPFDVCGNCEGHAMLLSLQKGLANSVETALTVAQLPNYLVENNPLFLKCPSSLQE